jgi:hypothetical protein
MHVFSTRFHGYVDYLAAIALIASPYVFRFADGSPAQWIPILLGLFVAAYSIVTRYELGAVPLLSMPTHLTLDVLGGIFLAASPWLFGFADRVYLPHLLFGLGEIVIATLTSHKPQFVEPKRESAKGARI